MQQTMRVRLLTSVAGMTWAGDVGDVVTLDAATAQALIAKGQAERATGRDRRETTVPRDQRETHG